MKRGVVLAAGLVLFLVLCYTSTLLMGLGYLEMLSSSKDVHYCSLVSPFPEDGNSPCDSAHRRLSSVLVIGALHFVGAWLVSHLSSLGMDVRALASYDSVLHDGDLLWYREHQLRTHHGVSVQFANLSNATQIENILRRIRPSEIVFVAPGVSGELALSEGEDHAINTLMSQSLEEFATALESLRKITPCVRVVLVSLSKHSPGTGMDVSTKNRIGMILAWMMTFELMISTYHDHHRIPFGIVRLNNVHGPWGVAALKMHRWRSSGATGNYCWYIKDVMAIILQMLNQSEPCLVLELDACSSVSGGLESISDRQWLRKQVSNLETSLKWAASYTSRDKDLASTNSNVIFTSYFTSTEDFQRNRRQSPNHFQYMAQFYWSLKKHRLKAVVFHDGLHPGFQHRLSSDYPKLSFIKVNSLHNRSTNDARFYAYYQYLREHPQIDRVLLTDISDVEIQKDPFQLMSLLGDWLYVGTDIDIFPNMNSMPWIEERLRGCFGNHSIEAGKISKLMRMDTVYNAGTIGGSRETVLNLLAVMVAYLDSTPASLNCNMPSLNFAVHEHFFEKVFTGFPLTSRFLRHQSGPKGVYLLHK